MGEPGEEHRWHEALERLGPELVRAKPEPGSEPPPRSVSAPADADSAPPEPTVDPLLHEGASGEAEGSRLQSLRYWAAVAGVAGVIAALIGLLALLPMSMR